jgi:murein DD-endopeptidase MepM/ murein hydrolase activator NlpD
MKKGKIVIIILLILTGVLAGIYLLIRGPQLTNSRTRQVIAYLRDPSSKQSLVIPSGARCGEAPFVNPSTGMIGFIWGDSFRVGHRHSGIDIFSGTSAGVTPVYAAYDGFLTREQSWKSSVIIRIPSDPLNPGEQIWTYYTHMADPDGKSFIVDAFPPGTKDVFVPAGTLLGYQGNYSGTSGNPTGIHLHFSIVKDDGEGMFLNELEIDNTLDPSPYFGLSLNASDNPDLIPVCGAD